MPIVEIIARPSEGGTIPATLPRLVADHLSEGLQWDVARFTVRASLLDPSLYFAKGKSGEELTQGHCLIHISCAAGKTAEEVKTIISIVAKTAADELGISENDVIVMFQELKPGCLLGNGRFM